MRASRYAAPLIVAAVAAAYFALFVHYGILLEDEGLILMQIARTWRGELPYQDFHTGYPPGTFYLNAALFALFGESVIPIRVLLVGVNAASTALLFVLVRQVAGTALGAAVALGWAAYLPVFVGLFAAFNVPYPSWYATLCFLATQLAFDRHLARGGRAPLVAAGIAAGLAFTFKQNFGALAALACGLTLALLRAGDGDPARHLARLLLVLAAGFLLMGFTVAVTTVEMAFILGPTLVLITGRLLWARAPAVGPPLAPAIGIVGAAMLAVCLPWLAPFLVAFGPAGLLREVFLVGTDFDLVYATPYPVPLSFPAAWPAVVAACLTVVALAGVAVQRGVVRRETAVGVVLAGLGAFGVLLVRWARMPEGLARSVLLQVQHIGFFAAPTLALAASALWLWRARGVPGAAATRDPRRLAVLVFALCMYAELYPRIDPTHLIIALPSGLVLAAWALRRAVDAWAAALRLRRRQPRRLAVLGAAALALVAAVPNFSALVTVEGGALRRQVEVTVASAAAPVFREDPRASDLRALNALLDYLRARLGPGEGLFGFPGMALVPFLLGHPSVTRHDYWYAGRPDHLEEAEVVRGLAADPPRFIVTLNRNLGFFSNSARYYFVLRAFVHERYTLAARFGRYDVLTRRELAETAPVRVDYLPPLDGAWLERLAEPLHESRRAVVEALLARAGEPEYVAREAAAATPDEPSLLLLLRAFGEAPDVRSIPFLAGTFEERTWRVQNQAALALNFLAVNVVERSYLLGRSSEVPAAATYDLSRLVEPRTLRHWLRWPDSRYQVGFFAAWILGRVNDRRAIPSLKDIVRYETRDPYLQLVAADSLVRLGRLEYLCDLVEFLGDKKHDYQDAVPSLLLEEAASHPAELTLCLSRGLMESRARGREVSAWTAGAAGLEGVAPALRDALADPERRVRIAAAWALGRLRDNASEALLARLAVDRDAQTRAFAREALDRLGEGAIARAHAVNGATSTARPSSAAR
jgi:HEAT repeat protein